MDRKNFRNALDALGYEAVKFNAHRVSFEDVARTATFVTLAAPVKPEDWLTLKDAARDSGAILTFT